MEIYFKSEDSHIKQRNRGKLKKLLVFADGVQRGTLHYTANLYMFVTKGGFLIGSKKTQLPVISVQIRELLKQLPVKCDCCGESPRGVQNLGQLNACKDCIEYAYERCALPLITNRGNYGKWALRACRFML